MDTKNILMLLIPLLVTLTISGWTTLREVVTKRVKTWPQWMQPIPPIVMSVVAAAAYFLVSGKEPDVTTTSLTGFATVGLYHVGRRWIPAAILDAIRTAAAVRKASSGLILILLLGCSTTLEQSRSEGLSRLTRGQAMVSLVSRDTARCHQLSDREANWKAVEAISGAFAVGFAGAAWPVESDRWEMVVVGTGVAGAAVTAYAESRRRSASSAWAEECSQ